jgi:hypothetical protein
MTGFVRLAKDPGAPEELREALERASAERASPEVLFRVLGAGVAGGLATGGGKHAGEALSRWFGASAAVKGISVVAIFAAGALIGGYAVHEHDKSARTPAASIASHDEPPPSPSSRAIAEPEAGAAFESAAPPPTRPSMRAAKAGVRAAVKRDPLAAAAVSAATPSVATTETAPESAPSAVAPQPALGSVHAELASLRRIRDAIDARRAADALAAIQAHRARYPESAFDEELLLLEAGALWAKRDPFACGILARFASRYPRSLLSRRAESLNHEARCSTP